jgi:hypothetical protein
VVPRPVQASVRPEAAKARTRGSGEVRGWWSSDVAQRRSGRVAKWRGSEVRWPGGEHMWIYLRRLR